MIPVPVQQKPALKVNDLRVYYGTDVGTVKAVDGVSFTLARNERIALVGESGSGKTTLALALMRMVRPPGYIASGNIEVDGVDMLSLNEEDMRRARLARISLVPQGAMNSLNPVRKVRDHIVDGLVDHGVAGNAKKLEPEIERLLGRVGLPPSVANLFPHELSGGMKQRVAMAMATSMHPVVIVADEPTSALDVVVQRQVMRTLRALQKETNAGVILVGHDMGLVAQFADRVGVMYAGKIVEMGPVRNIVRKPSHPYTRMLISSLPVLKEKRHLMGIPGLPPPLVNLPIGCSFAPRCPHAFNECLRASPKWYEVGIDHGAACYLLETKDG